MTKRTFRTLSITLAVGGVLAAVAVGILGMQGDGPGGMPPTYRAHDHDMRLTRAARTMLPVIDALDRYRITNGAFPADASGLAGYLPDWNDTDDESEIRGWHYTRVGAGYEIAIKLGWDPNLIYRFDGKHGQWIFDPGDGSEESPVELEP